MVLVNVSKAQQYLFDVLLLPVVGSVQKKRKHLCEKRQSFVFKILKV